MNPPPEDLTLPRSSLDVSHGLSVCPSRSCLSYLSQWCVGAESKVIMEVCVHVEVRFGLFPLILGGTHPSLRWWAGSSCTAGRWTSCFRPGLNSWSHYPIPESVNPVHFSCSFGGMPCHHYVLDLHYSGAYLIGGLVEREKPSHWISPWAYWYPVKLRQGEEKSCLYSMECKCLIGFIWVSSICSHLLNFPIECTVQFASLIYTALWKRSSHCDESIMAVWLEKVTPCALMPSHPRSGAHKWELSAEIG